MGFSKQVKDEILVKSVRHCCVCHKGVGLNIEVHHIKPKKQEGEDTLDNAIALCFNCHADAGHYFAGHPKGTRLSPEELKKHKANWFEIVDKNKIDEPIKALVQLIIKSEDFNNEFSPLFVKEEIRYIDRNSMKRIYELTGKDPMEMVNDLKEQNSPFSPEYNPRLNKVKTYDDFLDYLSDDEYESEDINDDTDCQPIKHGINMIPRIHYYKQINESNCIIDLELKNSGQMVLEDYKLYLTFENVIEVDSVNKRREYFDAHQYSYNIIFNEQYKGEYYPDNNVLVQNDSVRIDSICFRTDPSTKKVAVKWELFARDAHSNGVIDFIVKPKYEESERVKYVESHEVKEPTVRILPSYRFD